MSGVRLERCDILPYHFTPSESLFRIEAATFRNPAHSSGASLAGLLLQPASKLGRAPVPLWNFAVNKYRRARLPRRAPPPRAAARCGPAAVTHVAYERFVRHPPEPVALAGTQPPW